MRYEKKYTLLFVSRAYLLHLCIDGEVYTRIIELLVSSRHACVQIFFEASTMGEPPTAFLKLY
jgi:hypothetical protein